MAKWNCRCLLDFQTIIPTYIHLNSKPNIMSISTRCVTLWRLSFIPRQNRYSSLKTILYDSACQNCNCLYELKCWRQWSEVKRSINHKGYEKSLKCGNIVYSSFHTMDPCTLIMVNYSCKNSLTTFCHLSSAFVVKKNIKETILL